LKVIAETERLILRELLLTDDEGMFELDSDEDVHKYLSSKTVDTIEQSRNNIEIIRKRYTDQGSGWWAVTKKNTNEFLGWCGIKFQKEIVNNNKDFYELGYRFIKRYWSNGYATESAKAVLNYGFEVMKLNEVFAQADSNNKASRNVLIKCGLKFIETFNDEGYTVDWFRISKEDWKKLNS
jgi:[ribosomal protein S5]-alanine N-acetyltransferase